MQSQLSELEELRHDLTREMSSLRWKLVGWPKLVLVATSKFNSRVGREIDRFKDVLEQQRAALAAEVDALDGAVLALRQRSGMLHVERHAKEARKVWERIEAARAAVSAHEASEAALQGIDHGVGGAAVSHATVAQIAALAAPHHELWTLAADALADLDRWRDDADVRSLNGAVVLRKLNALHDHVTALRERLCADDEAEGARDAASSLLLTICELLAPDAKRLIAAASHNGLRERHVRIIHEEAGIDLGSQLPLGEVLRQLRASADVEAALAKMEAVAAEAGDEHEVELALTRMIETVSIEHARRTVG